MLSRLIPMNHADEVEHLVVELKSPKVVIGKTEIDQIESYAFAVAEDPRFRGVKARWQFWIISNDYDQYAKRKLQDDRYEQGVIYKTTQDQNITIWLKTWSQLLQENKHRLRFIRDKLNVNIDNEQALRHLKKTYAEYVEGITIADDQPEFEESAEVICS